jgi:hypothetical protein
MARPIVPQPLAMAGDPGPQCASVNSGAAGEALPPNE